MAGLDEHHPEERPSKTRSERKEAVSGERPNHAHYFDAQPEVPSHRRTARVVLPDLTFELQTDTGVFSHGRLDAGTKILLSEAPELPDTGVFLDLGSGAGPIAVTMALRRPQARVWAVDVNQRARDLVVENARRLNLESIRVTGPDGVRDDVTGEPASIDVIWSNPPIKIGKAALHDLLRTWLNRLNDAGEAVLVVHKNLGSDSLASWLDAQGWKVQRIASRQGYRVLRVTRNP